MSSSKSAAIIIAAHKEAEMPQGEYYLPLHVGCEGRNDLGFTGDNTGDNISLRNSFYSELTGLYWAWKNLNCEYLGLAHYRRHFSIKGFLFRKTHKPMECVLTDDELESLLDPETIIVPTRRNYYIETIASHYNNSMYDGETQLNAVHSVLSGKYPGYVPAFDEVMQKTSAHMFNMFVAPKRLANEYCRWLFDVLAEVETHVDSSKYSDFDKRYPGRLSEILFNVWLIHNGIKTKTIGRIDLWRVNWPKKITLFLAAKAFGHKQTKSS
ncbi:MAG: DUF4422 domain-containing protein [Actinomycetia bacterium]|nr:DUF4422 domain-containing protein [Actinomycetes bacterium]